MREILFRGRTLYAAGEQKWVYGNLCHDGLKKGGWCIEIEPGRMIGIDPDTVGQYTGLNDKNGTSIFEGDIVECYDYGGVKLCVSVVEYYGGGFAPFAFPNWEEDKTPEKSKIIGNIFDNPDIIEHE